MSRIDKVEFNLRDLGSALRRTARAGGRSRDASIIQKSFGETPPKPANISKDPELMKLFSRLGLIGWLEEKIKRASRQRGKIIPAQDITAMAMPHLPDQQEGNLVFLGVDFARKNQHDPDLLAGVLSHEWGHLVSDFLQGLNPNSLSWEQVHALRREEETYADAFAGRLLYLIGHTPEGLLRHLKNNDQGGAKYHDFETRKAIILKAFSAQIRQQETASRIFARHGERHPLSGRLIAEV